jgi:hypothetical protein
MIVSASDRGFALVGRTGGKSFWYRDRSPALILFLCDTFVGKDSSRGAVISNDRDWLACLNQGAIINCPRTFQRTPLSVIDAAKTRNKYPSQPQIQPCN